MKLRMTAIGLASLAWLAGPGHSQASYVERDDVRAFVHEMEARHGFDGGELLAALHRAEYDERVIRLITPPPATGKRSWQRYRARFLDDRRVNAGLDFWGENAPTLQAAAERFGVPAEIIVAIIGVETHYGRNTGNFETLSALATLAFDYPPRAPLFRRELESLFLLARAQRRDPFSYEGSYAGAIGYPQFLPSSILTYAVDFDGSGTIDFESGPTDAIGSVGRYLAEHGWRRDAPIAELASIQPDTNPAPLIAAGIEPSLEPDTLLAAGVTPASGLRQTAPAALVELETPGSATEYWLGYRNFYVITRYNKSSFYAMSVFELAETLRQLWALDRSGGS